MKGFFLDSEMVVFRASRWKSAIELSLCHAFLFCFFLPFLYASPVFTSANLSLSLVSFASSTFSIYLLLLTFSCSLPTSLVQDQFVQAYFISTISKICFAILTSLFRCLRSSSKTLPSLLLLLLTTPFVRSNQRNLKASTQSVVS